MKQKYRYQQKLEERSSAIICCEADKSVVVAALAEGHRGLALRAAEDLAYTAGCFLRDKVGAVNNLHGYINYARQILAQAA